MISTIIIADDHPIYRSAMAQTLTTMLPELKTFEASNIKELEKTLTIHNECGLLILDLHMPGVNGFEGLAYIHQNFPNLPIIMMSADEDPCIAPSAKKFGAKGFIPKTAKIPHIRDAVNAVLKGDYWFSCEMDDISHKNMKDILTEKVALLTSRQLEVFDLLTNGLLNKQIAFEMNVTEATVKAHLTEIMRKLNVNNRTEVILIANKINIEQFDTSNISNE